MTYLSRILRFAVAALFVSFAAVANELEIVAEFHSTRPGNPTITPNGRIIVSMQPLDSPEFRVVELMEDGKLVPFPTSDWADGPDKGKVGLTAVIGVDTTKEGIVWILDMGSASTPAQFVAWDSENDRLHKVVEIEKTALVSNSFLQDMAIDTKRNMAYIADTTLGNLVGETKSAIVVVDLETGKAKRVLEADAKLLPPHRTIVIGESTFATKRENGDLEPLYLGINPITIDHKNEWVYFGSVNGSDIYRIKAELLADWNQTEEDLSKSIGYFSKKKPSDGMVIDNRGNIYFGDVENSAVAVSNQSGVSELVMDQTLLSWADGFSIDQNHYLYIIENQLHLHPALNGGVEGSNKPYRLLRIKISE